MCGRFALKANTGNIEKLLPDIKISVIPAERYNIAPTQDIYIITNNNGYELKPAAWGLIPSWAKDSSIGSKMINARAETLFEKPSFRSLAGKKRCLIIASGYYEWQTLDSKSKKQPHYIYLKNQSLMTFAGLWDIWRNSEGNEIVSATIITCQPNELLASIHNRMPVVIPASLRTAWLDSIISKEAVGSMLAPMPSDEFDYHPVSYAVNNPSNDSQACIQSLTI